MHLCQAGAGSCDTAPACIGAPEPGAVVLAVGWADEQFRAEVLVVMAGGNGEFEVRIASAGDCFAVGPDKTIVNVMLANGLAVDLSCAAGMCGACVARVLEGTPDHRDIIPSIAEQAAGDEMALCCPRAGFQVQVLDL